MKNVIIPIIVIFRLLEIIFIGLDREKVVMQFGRIGDNEFSCDFRYPLTLMQAFGIALSAFDSRLFRE